MFRKLVAHYNANIVVIVLISFAIAASAIVFNIIDAVMFRKLRVVKPEQLVKMVSVAGSRRLGSTYPYSVFTALKEHGAPLVDLIAYATTTVTYRRPGEIPERGVAVVVSDNFFDVVGVKSLVGESLRTPDNRKTFTNEVIVSHAFWERTLARRGERVSNTVLYIREVPFTIRAVLPRGFNGLDIDDIPDLWISEHDSVQVCGYAVADKRCALDFQIVARLVSKSQITHAVSVVHRRFSDMRQSADPTDALLLLILKTPVMLEPMTYGSSSLRTALLSGVPMMGVGLTLLLVLVSASVGILIVSQAIARRRDTAIKVALGATTLRIAAESARDALLLVAAGTVAGLVLARVANDRLTRELPPQFQSQLWTFTIDRHLVLSLIAITLFNVIAYTVLPAMVSHRSELVQIMTRDSRKRIATTVLLSIQIASAMILLAFSGSMLHTVTALRAVNPGFHSAGVGLFSIDFSGTGTTVESVAPIVAELRHRVGSIPGISSVALAKRGVMRGLGLKAKITPTARVDSGSHMVSVNIVSDGYFSLMGMQIIRGRDFTRTDVPTERLSPTIINEALATAVFGGVDGAVGQTFGISGSVIKPAYAVIGVVNNARYRTLRETVEPTYYLPLGPRELVSSPCVMYYRTTGNPTAVSKTIRSLVAPTSVSVQEFTTLADEVNQSMWKETLLLYVAGAVSVLGVIMAGASVFGCVSQFVSGRMYEIYIRLALGARPVHLSMWVSQIVIPPLAMGITASIVVLLSIRRLVQPLMFQTRFADIPEITTALGVVLAVLIVAIGLPIRRMLHEVSISSWQTIR